MSAISMRSSPALRCGCDALDIMVLSLIVTSTLPIIRGSVVYFGQVKVRVSGALARRVYPHPDRSRSA
jgi:hypothetical protein